MSLAQRSANAAVGGRTARACDGCVKRRARWFCAADDAFLCQACDSSVHSANSLARRHDRVLLKTTSSALPSSSYSSLSVLPRADPAPAWLQGFRRKARTPRPHHHHRNTRREPVVVPDLEEEDNNSKEDEDEDEDDEEELLYRVPILDPVLAELYSPTALTESAKPIPQLPEYANTTAATADGFSRFHPSDVDLADFAADMESLLGPAGLDDDAFCMEGLGLVDASYGCDGGQVKVELDEEDAAVGTTAALPDSQVGVDPEFSRETLDINFEYGSPMTSGENKMAGDGYGAAEERRFILRLDYEAVIDAWSVRGCSPWTDGERPHLNPDGCWAEYTGMWGGEMQGLYGGGEVGGQVSVAGDSGREARVTRYREKRRTRLFSKKIRYEVRKLNAEKRPRMKGRFVKRTAFAPSPAAPGFAY